MVHQLYIEVPYITNPKVMRVYDSSIWDINTLSSEIRLDIIPPGFIYSSSHQVDRNFDKLFNVSNLGVNPVTDLSELTDLSDGIYIIRITNINGEQEDWVEFNHLRQVTLLNCWHSSLCKLNLDGCSSITKDVEKKRKALYQIKMYIDAAKADVEYCNAPNRGLELNNYAKKLLDKFNNECKFCL